MGLSLYLGATYFLKWERLTSMEATSPLDGTVTTSEGVSLPVNRNFVDV